MRKNCGLGSSPTRPFGDRWWLLPFLASLLVTTTLLLAAACGLFSPPHPTGDGILFEVTSFADWNGGSSSGTVEVRIKEWMLNNNNNNAELTEPRAWLLAPRERIKDRGAWSAFALPSLLERKEFTVQYPNQAFGSHFYIWR